MKKTLFWLGLAVFLFGTGRLIAHAEEIAGDVNTLVFCDFEDGLMCKTGQEWDMERGKIVMKEGREARGKGIYLDGTNRLTLPVRNNFNVEEGTVEMWFCPDWDGNMGLESYHHFFSAGNPAKYFNSWYIFYFNTNYKNNATGLLMIAANQSLMTGSQRELTGPFSWKAGEWHRIGGSWSFKEKKSSIMFDGKVVMETPLQDKVINLMDPDIIEGGKIFLGCLLQANEKSPNALEGIVDDFRISRKFNDYIIK